MHTENMLNGFDQSAPWAILADALPGALHSVKSMLNASLVDGSTDPLNEPLRSHLIEMIEGGDVKGAQRVILDALEAREQAAATQRPAPIVGGIAVLPISGTIMPRGGGFFFELFGLTSAESIGQKFAAAVADSSVGAIILDVNSPGGSVQGIDELSKQIFDARGSKPIVAVANHLAASAAYWIATAADELVVTPSGEVGSVGVFAAHTDISQALERDGIKTTLISAGKYKVEGNPYQPLSEEAQAAYQARVDQYYSMFTGAIARNRATPVADVRAGYGQGRAVGAKEALSLGMVDGIETIQQTIDRLGRRQTKSARTLSASADLELRQRRARALGGA